MKRLYNHGLRAEAKGIVKHIFSVHQSYLRWGKLQWSRYIFRSKFRMPSILSRRSWNERDASSKSFRAFMASWKLKLFATSTWWCTQDKRHSIDAQRWKRRFNLCTTERFQKWLLYLSSQPPNGVDISKRSFHGTSEGGPKLVRTCLIRKHWLTQRVV